MEIITKMTQFNQNDRISLDELRAFTFDHCELTVKSKETAGKGNGLDY